MILVTGATGTTGSEIVKQLSALGIYVRALVRNREKAAKLVGPNVEIVMGDLDKPETLDTALSGVERALLLPANTPQQVEQERNFIEAAKRAGTRHVVKFSVFGANVSSSARIARWHGQTEKLLEESGIPFTHLRPNFFMQNLLWFAPTITAEGVFYLPLKDAKVSLVDIRDIAAVAVKTLTEEGHEGKTYTITGPEALTFEEVAEKLAAATGKKVTYTNVSPQDFKQSLLTWGLPEWYADDLNDLYKEVASGYNLQVTNVVADVAHKQPISFDQFARNHAHVFTPTPTTAKKFSANVEVVRRYYQLNTASQTPGQASELSPAEREQAEYDLLDPKVEWRLGDGYALAGTYIGSKAVIEGIVPAIIEAFEEFSNEPEEFIDAGDEVVVLGHYYGRTKATKSKLNAEWIHIWTVRDGKIVRLRQYTNTAEFNRALGPEASRQMEEQTLPFRQSR
jgi:uncharacterized protein YbjT (DUF2867 family)